MTALNRKLIRDLLHMRSQVLAICLVLACGVATFVMALTTLQSLRVSQQNYYSRYRFADVFANLKRAPQALAGPLGQIPGVAQVQTRVVAEVTLDVPGMAEPAVGRLISLPRPGGAELNAVHLRQGRHVEPGNAGEVLVSEAFALAHELRPGDSLEAVLNGRLATLRIVGVALSPEYVLSVRGGESLPDDRGFGIFWMNYEELAAAFDMDGAFNDISLTVARDANIAQILRRVDRITQPYGGVGAYDRDDQISHRVLRDEISSLKGMAWIVPSVFLAVAAFLLNVVMTRLTDTQREEIAALKAFGYGRTAIGWHFVKFVLVIAVIGGSIGIVAGYWLAHGLTGLYAQFYHFPTFTFDASASVALAGLGIATGAAVLGTLAAVWRAVRRPAAEAMRPETPAQYRPSIIEKLGLKRLFTQPMRMVVRHLERRPIKSAMSVAGLSTAVAVLVMGNFVNDALDYMIEFGFFVQQRQDVAVRFNEPTSAGAMHEVRSLPGVLAAQPLRAVPVRLHAGHRTRRAAITGLPHQAPLLRAVGTDLEQIEPPAAGVLMADKLAEVLHLTPGETIRIEVMEGERGTYETVLAGVVREYVGTSIYMELDNLHAMLGEGDTVTGAMLQVDAREMTNLYQQLKRTPRVAGVEVKKSSVRSFNEQQGENQRILQRVNIVFACIIAVGVVYNTARISLAERSRELATLRVLGFSRAEISSILLGELAVLTVVALPFGMALGYAFAYMATLAFDSESFRIPLVVRGPTYGMAVVVVLLAAAGSGLLVRRKLDHLDLISALKAKE